MSELLSTKNFMALTGIKHAPRLSNLIRDGIVKATRINGRNYFYKSDVAKMLAYLNPDEHIEYQHTELEKMQMEIEALKKELAATNSTINMIINTLKERTK